MCVLLHKMWREVPPTSCCASSEYLETQCHQSWVSMTPTIVQNLDVEIKNWLWKQLKPKILSNVATRF